MVSTMSSATIDKLIHQARSLPEGDRSSFYENLTAALYTSAPNECVPGLRHLYLLSQATRANRRYPHQLLDGLVKNLLVPEKQRWLAKLMSALILQELAPSLDINLPMGNLPWDENQVPYILPVLLNQGPSNEEYIQNLVPKLIKWMSTMGVSGEVQIHSLVAAEIILRQYPHLLSKEHLHVVNSQLVEWLRNASLRQAPNPYSRGIFRKDTDQQPPVSELDGVITKNFFTILCIGQYYTSDQILNIHTFSMLRSWLIHQSQSPASRELLNVSQSASRASSPAANDNSSSGSNSRSSGGSLVETSLQYALRIIDQSERKPKVPQDVELQHASLMEAISILDHLCLCDSTLVPKVFETVKWIYSKASSSQPRVVLKLLQFFLNHAESVVYDASQMYEVFFKKTLMLMYVNAAFTFDVVLFLRDNLEALCYKTDLLQKYFPNILKIIAWNPRTYITEFVELLPAFLTATTTLEVLHTLLDLPCLTASLELVQQSGRASKSDMPSTQAHTVRSLPTKVLQKYKDPMYTPVFKFMLREDSGHGDTIDRLSRLHELIGELASLPRVIKCSETVPVLLTVLFEVVLEEGDKTLASNLIPVLLERSGVLYNIPAFQTQVRKVLSDAWVSVIKKYPSLVVSQAEELLEFVGSSSNIANREDFFIHVVWSIGEYFSPHYSESCSSDQISAMYETLEILAYEVSGRCQINSSSGVSVSTQGGTSKTSSCHSARLITSLMSTLAKLASRSQDLIPRVILCLSKLSQTSSSSLPDGGDGGTIEERASELISLLKLPNIASVVLNPSPELEKSRWPLEGTSLPVILQVTTDMLRTPEAAPS